MRRFCRVRELNCFGRGPKMPQHPLRTKPRRRRMTPSNRLPKRNDAARANTRIGEQTCHSGGMLRVHLFSDRPDVERRPAVFVRYVCVRGNKLGPPQPARLRGATELSRLEMFRCDAKTEETWLSCVLFFGTGINGACSGTHTALRDTRKPRK
jgi:hypothetical protein